MPFFRKDPFGEAWVLISPERGLQASEFGSVAGIEQLSPLSSLPITQLDEIFALRPASSPTGSVEWRVKVVEHPAPLLQDREVTFDGVAPFEGASNGGYQEIVIEHPRASARMETMSLEHLVDVLRVYRNRLALLSTRRGVKHIQLSRSVGAVAGALFEHPHAQILAMPVGNRWLNEERSAAEKFFSSAGCCLFCAVIGSELKAKERVITQNEDFVAIAPYASKQPFEAWVLPRRHSGSFTTLPGNLLPALAQILQSLVKATNAALNFPPYNMILHTLRAGSDQFHWHIECIPRLTLQAGFQWASGFYLNPTPPEDAARFLREAMALQEVGG